MIDEKGRLFGKINVVDLTVILLVIIALAGIGYNYMYANQNKTAPGVKSLFYNNAKSTPVEFVISIKGIREMAVDAISEGEKAYDNTTGTCLGTISKKEVVPYMDFVEKVDGTKVLSEVPDRYEVRLWIEFDGIEREGEFSTQSNLAITKGGTIAFNTPKVSTTGTVVSVYNKE